MTDANLFKTPENDGPDPVDEDKDGEAELVGEGKKFKDHKSLAKGKAESDAFISHLQKELAEMREELNKRITFEDLMTKITENKSTAPKDTSQLPSEEL